MVRSKKDRYLKYNATISGRFRELRRRAKARRLRISISKEDYQALMEEASCFYCEKDIDLLKGSGYLLDRINNSKGYYLNNVVICCPECNKLKSDNLNFEEALFVIRALKEFRKKLVKSN